MTLRVQLARQVPPEAELVGVPVATDDHDHQLAETTLAALGFTGELGQTAFVSQGEGPAVVAVGVGPSAAVDASVLRRAAAYLARAAGRVEHVATTLTAAAAEGVTAAAAAQAVAEGGSLGAYRFTKLRSEPGPERLTTMTVVSGGGARLRDAVDRGVRTAEAVCLARDLVNEPGGSLTPSALAEVAVDVARREGLSVDVLDRAGATAAGLGGLLAVSRGSSQEPRFVRITYEPEGRPRGTVALIGKGITFDAGGLSIKTAEGMLTMKSDMAGAAAVIGALSTFGWLRPKVRVRAYLPMTDNMLGPDATRVGDVITMYGGTTVEVLNTDAEGRLILADALAWASDEGADAIVDLATLTGACIVALGTRVAGVMGNQPGWIDQVLTAAERAGEAAWPLPLPDVYRKALDSKVADIKNVTGKRHGAALAAGLFLREFIGDGVPWAHIDMAGPAFEEGDPDGDIPAGGTGYGVRTLIELLASYRRPS